MNKYDSSTLLSRTPSSFMANPFLDGSILGNGKIGVAITGAISNEQILINHGALKHNGKNGVLQDVSDDFRIVRKNFTDGKIVDAEKVLEKALAKKNCKLIAGQPMPMAKIKLDFQNFGVITNYERVTDLRNGELAVSFLADGKEETLRRTSISRATDIIAYNVTKTNGKINVSISVEAMNPNNRFNSVKCENGYFYFSSTTENGKDYGMVIRVISAGGVVSINDNVVMIKDANELSLFCKPFANADASIELSKIKMELSLIKETYNKIASKNFAYFKKAFEDTEFQLNTEKTEKDMKELIEKTHNNKLTADLLERFWNFSKYISICLSGSELTPAGLWCADNNCNNGVIAFDGVAQLLYSGMNKTVNPSAIIDLLNYLMGFESDLKKNAARVYGMKGYFVPRVLAMDSATFGAVDSGTLHFIASSALVANLFYDYYLTTGDERTLRSKIFPFMKDVFDFYSDFLKLDSSGKYVTIPSYSPNSTPGNLVVGRPLSNFALSSSSTIDFLAIKTLLLNLIDSATVLKSSKDDIAVWQEMLAKIPELKVNGNGCMKEYTNSVFVDKTENAGVMHGYGLFPLKHYIDGDYDITYRPNVIQGSSQDAEIRASIASGNAVKLRVNNASWFQPTSNLAMAACQMAYANEAKSVYDLLVKIISSSATQSGLLLSNDWRGSGMTVNGKPNLDLSVSFGLATAISDCILQSTNKTLKVLPIMFNAISNGSIKNFATDFAANVSMSWDSSKGKLNIKINPKKSTHIDIIFNDNFKKLKNKDLKWDKSINGIRNVKLTENKIFTIDLG